MMFWLLVILFTLLALGFILFPLLRQNKNNAPESNALNVVIHKKRLAELETELEQGNIDEAKYNSAREEIERDLLTDIKNNSNGSVPETGSSRLLAMVTGIILPTLAIGLYLILGNWQSMDDMQRTAIDPAANEQQNKMPSVEEMIDTLVARIEQEPDNPEGWKLLGRSYLHVKKFADAEQALAKAVALTTPPTASLLVDYAEAIALGNELKLNGKPSELLARALTLDPQHQKAIWLSGFARYQEEEYPQAIKHWQHLQTLLPVDSPDHDTLKNYITQAAERGGISVAADKKPATPKIQIRVNVKLDDALADRVSADDVVFIYAHAAQGPRMPLAIVRKQASELPITTTLDESMAMTPGMGLLNFPEVIVNARISKSGQAIPQPGDLTGQSGALKTTGSSDVNIEINQIKE